MRLVARGLSDLAYPISIDPSVLVTLTADFALGGNAEWSADIGGDHFGELASSEIEVGLSTLTDEPRQLFHPCSSEWHVRVSGDADG